MIAGRRGRSLVAALLAAAAALAACGGDRAAPPAGARDAAVGARAAKDGGAATDDAAPESPWIGVIAASQAADVSSLFQGVILNVLVRPGDKVKANDVVVELDPRAMQEELNAAKAALGSAQAAASKAYVDVQNAQRKLKLEQKGFQDGVSPKANVDAAEFELRSAQATAQQQQAAVREQQSRVQTATEHLGNTTLRAKFDGTVATRVHDNGDTVQPGQAILKIVGEGQLRLKFAVPPERANQLTIGQRVSARIETIATPVDAVIQQVPPALDPASGMVIVEAQLAPDDATAAALRPGLAATIAPPPAGAHPPPPPPSPPTEVHDAGTH